MESSEKFSNTKDVIAFLSETFPACFSLEGEAKPLKIGIFQDLAVALEEEPRVSKTLLRSSLRHYTNSWRYLHSVKAGVSRVNLEGDPDAVVEKEHETHAQEQLAQSKQKVAEKRKLEAKEKGQNDDKKNYKKKTKYTSQTTLNGTNVKNKAPRSHKPKPQKLTQEQLTPGTEVTVKVGKAPMFATISEVAKDGVQVILASGMQMKVPESSLRLAMKKR
ncbi:MAG: RNA chaperone ProQ [Aestuariibacter sp.]